MAAQDFTGGLRVHTAGRAAGALPPDQSVGVRVAEFFFKGQNNDVGVNPHLVEDAHKIDVVLPLPGDPSPGGIQLPDPGRRQSGVHPRHAQLARSRVHPGEAAGQIRLAVEAVVPKHQVVGAPGYKVLPLLMEGADIATALLLPDPEDEVQHVPGNIHTGHLTAEPGQIQGIVAPAGTQLQSGLHGVLHRAEGSAARTSCPV